MAEQHRVSKQNSLIIFYVMYFVWLTTLTFLKPDTHLLNYFSIGIVVFYFVFLREKWDALWFIVVAFLTALISISTFENWDIALDYNKFIHIQYWFPLTWATTVVALRKFYIIMSRRGVQ